MKTEEIETVDIDTFCNENKISNIDFIKLDTEGNELEILEGAQDRLKDVVGVFCEVSFFETNKGRALFSDIDYFMRNQGFSLFRLNTYQLARNSLPPLDNSIFDVSKYGQVLFGDALYLRDLYSNIKEYGYFNPIKIIKLICIYEIFSLYDCAIELLDIAIEQQIIPNDFKKVKDFLLPCVLYRHLTYEQYLEIFRQLPQPL